MSDYNLKSSEVKANFGTYDKVIKQIQKWEEAIENLNTPFEKLKSTLNDQESKALQVCLDKITESAKNLYSIQTDLKNMYNGKEKAFNELKSYVTPTHYDWQFCVKIDTISTYKDLLTGDFEQMPQWMLNDINYRTHDVSETTTEEETQKQNDEKSNYSTLMNALSDLNFAWSNIQNDYNSIESNFNRLKTYVETDNKYYGNNMANNLWDGAVNFGKALTVDLLNGIIDLITNLPKLLVNLVKFVGEGVIKEYTPALKLIFKGNKGVNDIIDNSNKDFDKSIDTLKSGFNYVVSGKCLEDLKYEYQIHGWGGMIGTATGAVVVALATEGAGVLLTGVKSTSQVLSIISKFVTRGEKFRGLSLKLTSRASKMLNELKLSKGILSKVKFISKEVNLKNRLEKTGKFFKDTLYKNGAKSFSIKNLDLKKISKYSTKALAEKYTPYGYVKDIKKIINFAKDSKKLPKKLSTIDKDLNKNIKSKDTLENHLNHLFKAYETHKNGNLKNGSIVKEVPRTAKSIMQKSSNLSKVNKEIEKLSEEKSKLNDLNVNKENTKVLRNHKLEQILVPSNKIITRYNKDGEKMINEKDINKSLNNIENTLKSATSLIKNYN